MRVKDVFQIDAGASHIVLLTTQSTQNQDAKLLPLWIGESEALAISLRLARKKPPRPLTHDLLESLLSAMGGQITKIQIEDLRDSTFLGRVFLKVGSKTIDFDARPSDCIAMALGSQAPIFAAKKVLEKAGIDVKALGNSSGETPTLEDLIRQTRPPGLGQGSI